MIYSKCIENNKIQDYIYLYLDKTIWEEKPIEYWFTEKDKKYYKPIGDEKVDFYPNSVLSKIRNRVIIIENLFVDRLNLIDNCPEYCKPKTYKVLNGTIKNLNLKNKNNHLWFLKEDNTAYSQGINIFNNIEDVKKNIDIKKKYVLQKNISNMMLYKNKKFHIRTYLLVHYINHIYYFYLYKDGIVVVSKNIWDHKNIDKQTQITTSRAINDSVSYKKTKLYANLHKYIKKSKIDLIKNITDKLDNNENECFDLYGFDYIFNKKKNPYLLEVNYKPVINEDNKRMIKDLTNIIFNKKNYKNTNFSLIYKTK